MKKSRDQLVKEMHDRKERKYPELGISGIYKEYWDCYFESQDYEDEKEEVDAFIKNSPIFKPKNAKTK